LPKDQMRRVVSNIITKAFLTDADSFLIEPTIDSVVGDLCRRIHTRGEANYVLCRVVLESMKPEGGWGYHSLSDTIIVLEGAIEGIDENSTGTSMDTLYDCVSVCYDAADEIKRRLLGPYEDTAIRKNGDMACFANEPFAYLPPIDFTFDELAGGCCGCCPPVAEACCDVLPPIAEAFTQEQIDAAERAARKTG